MAKMGIVHYDSVEYWNEYYKKEKIQEESTFCTYIKKQINNSSIILDVGCGSGRDTFAFASDGYEAVGIDRSEEAIKFNNEKKYHGIHAKLKIDFQVVDLNDSFSLNRILEELCQKSLREKKNMVVYLRFLLHSINETTEKVLLKSISKHLPKGSYLAAEFRTIEDQGLDKLYDDHYRRFIVAEDLVRDLEDQHQFATIAFTKGTGLSKYKGEDPFLARILMQKK
ncbi:class I SAM-dependent methyltransferase [Brevibacillus nitrificans]|uniref:Class I SAM-dependent methyltransferase n=1 Tax=Brevibacillus nitrificans TaxID=651560 RepID=A0A3M8DPQ3_9BACL|nr:class I SAM-dependent methyltransferase [Brevibacillus nitrificans]RNB90103.1 class I SAM-dependent methyltransferase [Brevibacillus nitrificans]